MSVDWTNEAAAAAALRARGVESDLSDASLHAFAKDAVAAIAARGYGPQSDVVAYYTGIGQSLIELRPPASAISEVLVDDVEITAGDDGYRIRPGGQFLERLSSGYLTTWSGQIVVTFDASPADDRYDRVVVDLVKLALEYSGLDSRRDGDYAEESKGARGGGGQLNYHIERDALIAELGPAWSFS